MQRKSPLFRFEMIFNINFYEKMVESCHFIRSSPVFLEHSDPVFLVGRIPGFFPGLDADLVHLNPDPKPFLLN